MTLNLIYKSFLPLLILGLSGCNAGNVVPAQETSLANVSTTEQQATLAYQAEDWATAEREYSKLTRMVPTDSQSWFRLGNVYVRMNRPGDALLAYREALIRNPDDAKTWHNMGIVQLKQATNTFLEMQNHLQTDDPLYKRADQVVKSVTKLLGEDFVKTE